MEELQRARLIDHFKRAYQIIVGLAITNACFGLFLGDQAGFDKPGFWTFCIFFITIVPIFHGGDRSLDIKYLGNQPVGFFGRAAYIWDVYMLLITAVLFVKIAQHIYPDPDPHKGQTDASQAKAFYGWMVVMLAFDVLVLIIDRIKSRFLATQGEEELSAYWRWIVLNIVLALFCYDVWGNSPDGPFFFISGISLYNASIVVFIVALIRTVLDYVFGKNFMFP